MTLVLIKNPRRLLFKRSEALRVAGPCPELVQYIRAQQIDEEAVTAHAGGLDLALAAFHGDTFDFDIDGEPAAVIDAYLFDHAREQAVADLVAWPIADPAVFATAMGCNDGADILGPVHMIARHGAPLKVHRTPLGWLKAKCEGCVPLKPGARHWLVWAGGPFIAEDIEHGRELREMLGHRHRILIPQTAEAA